jgi:hypothetical protein
VNLALPALVILLALLPGVVFERAYFAGRFARRWAGLSTGSEVALYVLLAIPIDVAAVEVCKWLDVFVDWPAVVLLAFGALPDSNAVATISGLLAQDIRVTVTSYAITVICSYALGASLRRAVWAWRLDTKLHILRMKNEWFYQLLPRGEGIPSGTVSLADVMASLPGENTRLYRGVVSSFQLSSSGGLELIKLADAKRGRGRGASFEWVPIPGEGIMLLGHCVHSINVRYVALEEGNARDGWWRRFLFEEQ